MITVDTEYPRMGVDTEEKRYYSCYTRNMSDWEIWLRQVSHGESESTIAARLGVSRATVNRWRRRESIDPATIIKLARIYHVDPVRALMSTGWLNPADLSDDVYRNVVKMAPAHMLVAELHNRYQTGTGATSPFNAPPEKDS